jgi:hypothetical protein
MQSKYIACNPSTFVNAKTGKPWKKCGVTLDDVYQKLEEVSDAIESLIEPIAEAISAIEMEAESTEDAEDADHSSDE